MMGKWTNDLETDLSRLLVPFLLSLLCVSYSLSLSLFSLLQEEMERMIAECKLDCQAYQQALGSLERGDEGGSGGHGGGSDAPTPSATASASASSPVMTEEQFEREILKCKEEERKEVQKIQKLEQQLQVSRLFSPLPP